LPAELRLDFIKKVYGLVFYMLSITFVIASPFIFDTYATMKYISMHPWIPTFAGVVFVGLYAMNMMVMFAYCCDCRGIQQAYLKMFTTVPLNLVFLTVVASAFGIMVGFISVQYTAVSVCYAFLASAIIVAALTMYAVMMKGDVTGMGMYVMVGCVGIMLIMMLQMFGVTGGPDSPMNKLIAGGMAMFFGFLIVYDTQLIFGAEGASHFSGMDQQRQLEYTLDMYAFAAYQLYLDYINFLIQMIKLMGERRD
jgi:FtsH-binding integral membrane protein